MSKQAGFFDKDEREQKLRACKDFLERVNRFVSWEEFRPLLLKVLGREEPKAGRPPHDAILMFKILVLQALYNMADEQTEYQILDRLSFMSFLGLELHDKVPDARTIWLFRETLRKAGAIEILFARFDEILAHEGFAASGGQIVDATFVEVPRQRNKREENKEVKEGKVPEGWSPKKRAHKDTHARWTKKNGMAYYGYKNHVNADRTYKLIRGYKVTDASVHDSQELNNVLLHPQQGEEVWADSAYRSAEQEAMLKEQGYTSYIHERAYRDTPLTEEQKATNKERSKVRARGEHVFGHMATAMNGCFVRSIGILRARAKVGLENLAYNIARFTFLMTAKTKNAAMPA